MPLKSTIIAGLLVSLLAGGAWARAQVTREVETDLARLARVGTIVYLTAHPDDESAAIITYLARGLHARVVILSMTRGGGGQDLNGPQLGEELAEVRTRELERAAAGYGAEVRFVGAEDFGYSKSLEETLEHWDEEKLTRELVRQIRLLRPLAVISHWSGTERDGGGAHHQAAGLLARRAFVAAGDADAFPEQLQRGLIPWQARYLLIRTYRPGAAGSIEVPVRQPSPVPGKTYEELGWEAFQNHRSQGLHLIKLEDLSFLRRYFLRVGATGRNGLRTPASAEELVPYLSALPDLFPTVEFPAGSRNRLVELVGLAEKARQLAKEGKAGEAALALVQGAGLLKAVVEDIPAEGAGAEARAARVLLGDRQQEFLKAAAALAGVKLEALADRAVLTPGERIWVGLSLRIGDPAVFRAVGFELDWLQPVAPEDWRLDPVLEGSGGPGLSAEYFAYIPETLQPEKAPYPALRARAQLKAGTLRVGLDAPVQGLAAPAAERPGLMQRLDPRRLFGREEPEASTAPAQLAPVSIAPAVTLEMEPRLRLLRASPGETTRDWCVHLEAHRSGLGKIPVWLEVPMNWYTPLPQETELGGPGARATTCFPLTVPARMPPGGYELQPAAGRGTEVFRLSRRARFRGTSKAHHVLEPALAHVEILDVSVPAGLHIGYIGFNNDPTPALLAQLGVGVDMLDERALKQAPLDLYDAILIATRAYDYRDDLAGQTPRLLDYVKGGGTLVVEHQGRRWEATRFAPYPASKPANRNLRVTHETAAVKVLVPEHPVLNFPNRIGAEDWENWVQERGLYFWESWSENYTPLLEMADPGEDPQRGALVYARYGEGAYIYCGLALFRQVRAGVPGGVRLYVNLLSQRRASAMKVSPAAYLPTAVPQRGN